MRWDSYLKVLACNREGFNVQCLSSQWSCRLDRQCCPAEVGKCSPHHGAQRSRRVPGLRVLGEVQIEGIAIYILDLVDFGTAIVPSR